MLRFCLPALFAVLFSSCLSEPDCILTASSDVRIVLQVAGTADSARFVKFDSIGVSGTNFVFYTGDSVSSVVIPINTGDYQTTFRFYYESEIDSIVVSYTRNTRVISPSCGAFNYYQDLAVVLHTFPTVTLLQSQLSTSHAPNLSVKL